MASPEERGMPSDDGGTATAKPYPCARPWPSCAGAGARDDTGARRRLWVFVFTDLLDAIRGPRPQTSAGAHTWRGGGDTGRGPPGAMAAEPEVTELACRKSIPASPRPAKVALVGSRRAAA